MNSKETAKVITEYAKAMQESLPDYRVTIVIRDPREKISVHSVIVVTNDEPKKVLEAIRSQAIIQPNFHSDTGFQPAEKK